MRDIAKGLALLTQIGLAMLTPIIGCILLGHYLDEKLQTKVLFLIVFTILGVGAAFRNLFYMTNYKDK